MALEKAPAQSLPRIYLWLTCFCTHLCCIRLKFLKTIPQNNKTEFKKKKKLPVKHYYWFLLLIFTELKTNGEIKSIKIPEWDCVGGDDRGGKAKCLWCIQGGLGFPLYDSHIWTSPLVFYSTMPSPLLLLASLSPNLIYCYINTVPFSYFCFGWINGLYVFEVFPNLVSVTFDYRQ